MPDAGYRMPDAGYRIPDAGEKNVRCLIFIFRENRGFSLFKTGNNLQGESNKKISKQ